MTHDRQAPAARDDTGVWASLKKALRGDRTPRPTPGQAIPPPDVSLYGFEAHGTWASAMLHNRSGDPIVDARPLIADDDPALVGRGERMVVAAGALVQVAFPGRGETAPSPARCFVELTDADGHTWVVGVDQAAPRPLGIPR